MNTPACISDSCNNTHQLNKYCPLIFYLLCEITLHIWVKLLTGVHDNSNYAPCEHPLLLVHNQPEA